MAPPAPSQVEQNRQAANRLFVQAAKLFEEAKTLDATDSNAAKVKAREGLLLARKLIDRYPETDLAVQLMQGQKLFDGFSLSMIQDRLTAKIYELPSGGGVPELKQKPVKIVNVVTNKEEAVPIKLDLETLLYDIGKGASFAGSTRQGKVRFIRLRYTGGDWDQDLDLNSDLNMLLWYSSHTDQPTAKLPETRSIGQLKAFPATKSPPLVYITGQRGLSVSQSEVDTLREYLVDKRGMLFADNGGSAGWHAKFFELMRRVLPKVQPRALPIDHPVHSGLSAIPIVTPHGGQTAYGWVIESRIVAYYHPGDIGDAWADGHAGVPRRIWEPSYRLGGNIIHYAHSEYSKWLRSNQPASTSSAPPKPPVKNKPAENNPFDSKGSDDILKDLKK